MNTRTYWLITLLLALSLLFAACSAPVAAPEPAQAPAAQAPAAQIEPTQAPEPTQVPEPAEAVVNMEVSEEELDTAFNAFLGRMVAYNTIRPDGLNELLAEDPPPFVLDVRQPAELEENGHIESAVHIPLRELGQHLDLLPAFDEPIVAYCGIGWRCTIAMTELGLLGWTNVKALVGGSFGGWVEAGYPVIDGAAAEAPVLDAAEPDPALVALADETLSSIPEGWGVITVDQLNTELAEKPGLILIDVRSEAEVEENGVIDEGQRLIPLEEFVAMRNEWPAQDAEIVTYCGTGHRCTMAMTILWNYGYTNVRSLKGGLNAWSEAGYPVIGGAAGPDLDTAFNEFLGRMVAYNTIRPDGLNELLAEDPPPFVLDVRQPAELEENGHIEGAVHIPLRELGKHLDLLPAFDEPIVAYCGVGWRCTIAMTTLGALGWTDVKALVGGSFGGWVEGGYPVVAGAAPEAAVLDAAQPDAALAAVIDQALSTIPDGWGVITVDQLATELLDKPDLILIDVRTTKEVEENGVIEHGNHLVIPLEEFVKLQDQWPAPDAEIVTYCGSGHRCTMAMTILWTYGYTNVRSLKGGLNAWTGAGYPVVDAP